METWKLNQKFGEWKQKTKKWVKDHEVDLIVCGTTAVLGGIIIGVSIKYADSIPVTVDDVTEVTELPIPEIELENVITMYDDRLDMWVPVIRKLTDEEFDNVKQLMTDDPDVTLSQCLMEMGLLPDYLYEYE